MIFLLNIIIWVIIFFVGKIMWVLVRGYWSDLYILIWNNLFGIIVYIYRCINIIDGCLIYRMGV